MMNDQEIVELYEQSGQEIAELEAKLKAAKLAKRSAKQLMISRGLSVDEPAKGGE